MYEMTVIHSALKSAKKCNLWEYIAVLAKSKIHIFLEFFNEMVPKGPEVWSDN